MSRGSGNRDRKSISAMIRQLVVHLAVPLGALALFIFVLFLIYGIQYAKISSNISIASQFNQNFKDEVDLKMYYFVTGNSDSIPTEEVETAEELAGRLLESTRNRESRRAASSVLNLCQNLKNSFAAIEASEGYDLRMHQLETNVYVITELIQDYMYTYLYHEAGELAGLRNRQTVMLGAGLALSAAILSAVVAVSLRRSFQITRSVTRPIDELYRRVTEIGQGDLSPKPPVQADDSKLSALGEGLEDMAARLSEQMDLNRKEQERLRSMELALVQAQVNPHFLYNTLDAITWLVETGKKEQAVEMVTSLSNYFRTFLSNGKDIITLRDETLHVRSYLEIQQVRYHDVLRYELNMDSSLEECLVPKMTLQPLVENAIYHGIKPKRGLGWIRVSSRREGGTACLEVRDTGAGMSREALESLRESLERDEGSGFGMLASYRRLKLLYGDALQFSIDSEEGHGTVITVRFPERTGESV